MWLHEDLHTPLSPPALDVTMLTALPEGQTCLKDAAFGVGSWQDVDIFLSFIPLLSF